MLDSDRLFLDAVNSAVKEATERAEAVLVVDSDVPITDVLKERALAEASLLWFHAALTGLSEPSKGVLDDAMANVRCALGDIQEADHEIGVSFIISMPDAMGEIRIVTFRGDREISIPTKVTAGIAPEPDPDEDAGDAEGIRPTIAGDVDISLLVTVPADETMQILDDDVACTFEVPRLMREAIESAHRVGATPLLEVLPGFNRRDTPVAALDIPADPDAPVEVDLDVAEVPIVASAPFAAEVPSIQERLAVACSVLNESEMRTYRRHEAAISAMVSSLAGEMSIAQREFNLFRNDPDNDVYRDWCASTGTQASLRRASASVYLDALPQMVAEKGASGRLVTAVRDMAMTNLGEIQAADMRDGWSTIDFRDVDGNLRAVEVVPPSGASTRYAVPKRPAGVDWTYWSVQKDLKPEETKMPAPAQV